MRIGITSCVKTKRSGQHPAASLYSSPLFVKSAQYLRRTCDKWLIISSKYGILEPTDLIEPYDETFKTMPRDQRLAMCGPVAKQLRRHIKAGDHVVLICGKRYLEVLRPGLEQIGCTTEVLFTGMKHGQRMKQLLVLLRPRGLFG